jgi:hypothetical protein
LEYQIFKFGEAMGGLEESAEVYRTAGDVAQSENSDGREDLYQRPIDLVAPIGGNSMYPPVTRRPPSNGERV